MGIKLKNSISKVKIKKILEKSFIILVIIIGLLIFTIYESSKDIVKLNNNISSEKSYLKNQESEFAKISSGDKDVSFIDFSFWSNYLAGKANLQIYKGTDNLKDMATYSKENYKLIINNKDYSNFVKFIIIDKKKKDILTNDYKNIDYIRENVDNFSIENGKLFSYVSNKGKWYNISYDSALSPGSHMNNLAIDNGENYVEAYWFPKDYKLTEEDMILFESLLDIKREEINKIINSYNIGTNSLIRNRKSQIIKIIGSSLLIILIFIIFYIMGRESIINSINNSKFIKLLIFIENWFGRRSTLFKFLFFITFSYVLLYILINAMLNNRYYLIKLFPYIFLFYIIFIFPKAIGFCIYLDKIIKGANKITAGDIDHEIRESNDISLMGLAANINKINRGFKVSIDEQIKNERLKSELVANVSHDLKTPLTSIINYTDILLREDISEEEKVEFIKIVNRKGLKLKNLIEDLFEISKINSGKEEIKKEALDVVELINQSVAEYGDFEKYRYKKIIFNVNAYNKKILMNLDGTKMSRVFENLIINALKYSIPDTRVFINIEDINKGIKISFKNISLEPLDFDKGEIFQRFTRGDKGRNSETEGNGLGLSIAKSIVELHGGIMYIDFEGDMFKAIVELYRENI